MNRRGALATLGAAAATLGGYGGLRVGDYRPYDASLDEPASGRSAAGRVVAAGRRLHVLDHRAVTEVSVRPEGDAPYLAARYRRVHEHSRRRHLASYTTFRVPPGEPGSTSDGLLARLHGSFAANADTLPRTSVVHVSDGTVVADWDAPTPEGPDEPPRFDGDDVRRSATRDGYPHFGDHLLPEPAAWHRVTPEPDSDRADEPGGSDEGVERYEVTEVAEYARAVPLLLAVEVHDGSRLTATLDAETGLLRGLSDRRVVAKRVGDDDTTTRTVAYDIETRFDRYGEATAPRPPGAPLASPRGYLRELAVDLSRY